MAVEAPTGERDLGTLLNSTSKQFRATRFWLDIASKFEQKVPKKRHWRNFKAYNDCFVCSKAISLLTKQIKTIRPDADRIKAIWLLQSFQDFGLIEDVRGPHRNRKIADDSRLLRFAPNVLQGNEEDSDSWAEYEMKTVVGKERPSMRRKRRVCSRIIFQYICHHFELTAGIGDRRQSADGPLRRCFLEQLSKEACHAYDNIALDLGLCDKFQTLPDWLIDVMTQLSQWPTPFEKSYQIFLPNMLEMILDYVKQADSFGLRRLLALFDEMTTRQVSDKADDFRSEGSDNLFSQKANISSVQNAIELGPFVADHEDRRMLASHLQHVTLLLKPSNRANLAYFICLIQKMDKNVDLSAKPQYINWITDLQHVLVGGSNRHERLFSVLRYDIQSSFKVPRILAGLYCQTNDAKDSGVASSFVSRLKSNIGASRFSIDRRRKRRNALHLQ